MKKSEYIPMLSRIVLILESKELTLIEKRDLHRLKNFIRSKEADTLSPQQVLGEMRYSANIKKYNARRKDRGIAI